MDHDPLMPTDTGATPTSDDTMSGFRPFGHAVTRRGRHVAEEIARAQSSPNGTVPTDAPAGPSTLVAEVDAPYDQDASPLPEAPLPPAAPAPTSPAAIVDANPEAVDAPASPTPPPPPPRFMPPALPDSWRPPARDDALFPSHPVIGPPPPREERKPEEPPTWTPPGAARAERGGGARPPRLIPAAIAGGVVVALLLAVVLFSGGGGGDEPRAGKVALTEDVDTEDLGPAPTTTEPPTTTTTEAPTTTSTTEAAVTVDSPLPGLASDVPTTVTQEQFEAALAEQSDPARAGCVATSIYDQLDQAAIDQIAAASSLNDLPAATQELWTNTWIGCDKIVRGVP